LGESLTDGEILDLRNFENEENKAEKGRNPSVNATRETKDSQSVNVSPGAREIQDEYALDRDNTTHGEVDIEKVTLDNSARLGLFESASAGRSAPSDIGPEPIQKHESYTAYSDDRFAQVEKGTSDYPLLQSIEKQVVSSCEDSIISGPASPSKDKKLSAARSGEHLEHLNQPKVEHDSDGYSLKSYQLFDPPKGPLPPKPLLAAAMKAREQAGKLVSFPLKGEKVAAARSSEHLESLDQPKVEDNLEPRSVHGLEFPPNSGLEVSCGEDVASSATLLQSLWDRGSGRGNTGYHSFASRTQNLAWFEEKDEELDDINGAADDRIGGVGKKPSFARKSYLDFIVPAPAGNMDADPRDVPLKGTGSDRMAQPFEAIQSTEMRKDDRVNPESVLLRSSLGVDRSQAGGAPQTEMGSEERLLGNSLLLSVEWPPLRNITRKPNIRSSIERPDKLAQGGIRPDPPDESTKELSDQRPVSRFHSTGPAGKTDDYSIISNWAPPSKTSRGYSAVLPESTHLTHDLQRFDLMASSVSSGSSFGMKDSSQNEFGGRYMASIWALPRDCMTDSLPRDGEEKCEHGSSWELGEAKGYLLQKSPADKTANHEDGNGESSAADALAGSRSEHKALFSESRSIEESSQREDETGPCMSRETKGLLSPGSELSLSSSAAYSLSSVDHAGKGIADMDPEKPHSLSSYGEARSESTESYAKTSSSGRAGTESREPDIENGLGFQSEGKEIYGGRFTRHCLLGCFVLSLLLVAAVVSAAILLANNDEPSTQNRPSTDVPVSSPTPSPSDDDLESFIRESLTAVGSASNLENATSPQSIALDWILESDAIRNISKKQHLQRFVLAVLYYSTDGNKWINSDGWLSDQDECEWFFSISKERACNDSGEMSELHLTSNNIKGEIPWIEFAMLRSQLLGVHLSDNSIAGTVPGQLGLLTQLTSLDLSENQISGSIPSEFGLLRDLKYQNLAVNRLGGQIPIQISMMTSLETIQLSSNHLTGMIPSELGLISSLHNMYFRDNLLTGTAPAELCALNPLNFEVSCDMVKCECCTNTECLPPEDPLLALLNSVSEDGGLALEDTESPQFAALQWLRSPLHNGFLSNTRTIQRFALATLYFATGGDLWKSNAFWLTSRNECDWFSSSTSDSTCDSSGTIVELDLRDNSLSGRLPKEILLLSETLGELLKPWRCYNHIYHFDPFFSFSFAETAAELNEWNIANFP
jgi:hypothetical protein